MQELKDISAKIEIHILVAIYPNEMKNIDKNKHFTKYKMVTCLDEGRQHFFVDGW